MNMHPKKAMKLLEWAAKPRDAEDGDELGRFAEAPLPIRDNNALAYLAGHRLIRVHRIGKPLDPDACDIGYEGLRDIMLLRMNRGPHLSIELTGLGRAALAYVWMKEKSRGSKGTQDEKQNEIDILTAMKELNAIGPNSGKTKPEVVKKAFGRSDRNVCNSEFARLRQKHLTTQTKRHGKWVLWLTREGMELATELSSSAKISVAE
jgi:hypothetical protein